MWELIRRYLYSDYYSPMYKLMAVRRIESLAVKGKEFYKIRKELRQEK